MELKGRLKLIANKTPKCSVACDIGTDHAYIPIFLVQRDICQKAIAADVKKGPIEAAIENIKKYGLEDRIEARLGNGLDPIHVGEADAIIIAGMGGNLIAEILQRGINKAREAKSLVLQPMNDMDICRKWLYDNGFEIYDEELVEEGTKIYNVICTKWSGKNATNLNQINYQIGERLLQRKDPLLGKLISKKILQLGKAITELQNAGESSKQVIENYNSLLNDLRDLKGKL